MRVLQAGMDKSGNYWLWRIIRSLMEEAGIRHESWIRNDPIYEVARTWTLSFPEATELDVITWDQMPSSAFRADNSELQPFRERSYYYSVIPMFRRRIDDLEAYVRANTHLWTHAPWHDDLPVDLLDRLDKSIYIVRDPRDVLVSSAHFVDTEYCQKEFGVPRIPLEERYARLVRLCAEWVAHVAGWVGHAQAANVCVVSYEGLSMDLRRQLERLSDYLGLALTGAQLDRVADSVSFGAMRERASDGHVRKGKVGNWRQELPADVADRAAAICGPLLDLFGYSRTDLPLTAFLTDGVLSEEILSALAAINRMQNTPPGSTPQRPRAAPSPGSSGGWR